MASTEQGLLEAPYVLEYTYRRSLGSVLSQFFTGLRDGRILGAKTAAGKVLVPPCEYAPLTGEDVAEVVEVAESGVVTTWAWVGEPRAKHPMQAPFAWALIKLDGADSGLLHAVDTGGDEGQMRTGMRVRVRWSKERVGSMADIECFEPLEVSR